MNIRILTAVAAVVLAGCQAQEGLPQAAPVPGLPPTAMPDVVVVETDSTNNPINALANDIDLSGTGLTITAVTVDQTLPPLAGAVATTNGATVSFTPPATFVGVVTLLYDIADGDGGTSSGAIAVSVLPIAPPPVALADVVVVETDSTNNSINALLNDIDLSGTGLTITSVTVDQTLPPMAGTVATTNGATVTFTPPATFTGVVTLLYDIADGNGGTASGAIAVSVLPIAPPPVALPDVATVMPDSGANDIDVLVNDIDPSGGGLTLTGATVATSVPPGTHGIAVVANQARFTPAAGFVGTVVVNYTIADGNGETADGVLTILISPVPPGPPPVALTDVVVVETDSTNNSINALLNDIDLSGTGLTITSVTVDQTLPPMAGAVATTNGTTVTFTPPAGFTGAVTLLYDIADANGGTASGAIAVSVLPIAPPPVALPDAATVMPDSGANDLGVLANDIDLSGGGLTLTGATATTSVPAATHTVTLAGNLVRFTPAAAFTGAVVVSYTITDGNGETANGVLSIVVSPLALPVGPVPLPDAATVAQNSPATNLVVLNNDIDPSAGGLTLTGATVTTSVPAAAHTVTMVGNLVGFTPAAGFAGAVVITYEATDVNGNSANGLLNIVVTPLNPVVGLVAIPDVKTVAQDSGASDTDVLANDVNPAGGAMTVTGAVVTSSQPAAAHTVSVVGNQVRFTPAVAFAGVVVVTYTAQDANGQVSNGLLTITITPSALQIPPLALPDAAAATSSGGIQLFNVIANDVNPAGGSGLTLTMVSMVGVPALDAGSVAIVGNQVQYTPVVGYMGIVTVTYTVQDINGNTSTSTLTLTVTII